MAVVKNEFDSILKFADDPRNCTFSEGVHKSLDLVPRIAEQGSGSAEALAVSCTRFLMRPFPLALALGFAFTNAQRSVLAGNGRALSAFSSALRMM